MSARLKVYLGVVLCAPLVLVLFAVGLYALAHPALTQTQLFIEWAPYEGAVFLLAVPGFILIQVGCAENDDE